mmetsp:Transcript_22121/g.42187  ORF Transcript_22121/g.42187 Transcript_22121/m.42187 type:complete len:1544 (-) Transcript_22121:320-4951(-)
MPTYQLLIPRLHAWLCACLSPFYLGREKNLGWCPPEPQLITASNSEDATASCFGTDTGTQDKGCHILAYDPHPVGEAFNSARDQYSFAFNHFHHRDLQLISETGANMIKLRAWDYHTDHEAFLKICKEKELSVMVTFSVYEYIQGKRGFSQARDDYLEFLQTLKSKTDKKTHENIVAVTVDQWPLLQDSRSRSKYFNLMDLLQHHTKEQHPDVKFVVPLNLDPDNLDTKTTNYDKDANSSSLLTTFFTDVEKHTGGESKTWKWMLQRKVSARAKNTILADVTPKEKGSCPGLEKRICCDMHIVQEMMKKIAHIDKNSIIHMLGVDPLHEDKTNDQYQDKEDGTLQEEVLHAFLVCGHLHTAVDEFVDSWDRSSAFECTDGQFVHSSTCGHSSIYSTEDKTVATKEVAVERVGIFAQYTWLGKSCLDPRFENGKKLWDKESKGWTNYCVNVGLQLKWYVLAVAMCTLAIVSSLVLGRVTAIFRSDGPHNPSSENTPVGEGENPPVQTPLQIDRVERVATIDVEMPSLYGLNGPAFKLALKTCRLDADQAEIFLTCHLEVQQERLDRQIFAEELAQRCMMEESGEMWTLNDQMIAKANVKDADIRKAAICVVHARCLEAYFAWSELRVETLNRSRLMDPGRDSWMLYAEAILVRMVESLGEHIMQAPERISQVLHRVRWPEGMEENGDLRGSLGDVHLFEIDYEDLQDGLEKIHKDANPFAGNINFDDINECGRADEHPDARIRDATLVWPGRMRKTYQESTSVMVVLDFVRTFRTMIFIKAWLLALAGCVRLGSVVLHLWACADAVALVLMELLVLVFDKLQRKVGVGLHCNPTTRDLCEYYLTHLGALVLGMVGIVLYLTKKFDESKFAVGYLAVRAFTICILAVGRTPMLLPGTPLHRKPLGPAISAEQHSQRRRTEGRMSSPTVLLKSVALWILMLACCVLFEANFLIPMGENITFEQMCSDVCHIATKNTGRGYLRSDCFACGGAVFLVWVILCMTATIDIWFVFNVFVSFIGAAQGWVRNLDGVRSTALRTLTFNETDPDSDGYFMMKVFGVDWKLIWAHIVEDFFEDCYLSNTDANTLVECVGMPRARADENHRSMTAHGTNVSTADLGSLTPMAKERLSFFFASLRTIARSRKYKIRHVAAGENVCYSDRLSESHVGTIPSLTAVIPAYNEVVLCSSEYLKDTDTVNTNLHFLRSQFSEEWDLLAEKLSQEPDALEHNFIEDRLSSLEVVEVRRWASMRAQSVGKTVLGAVAYMQALWALPRIRQFYNQAETRHRCGEKRLGVHCQLILAHQTYGQKDKNEKNNSVLEANEEAIRVLMCRYKQYPVHLIFDLDRSKSKRAIMEQVEEWMEQRFNDKYVRGSLQFAGVKLEYNDAHAGAPENVGADIRSLRVVHVVPRSFKMRIGPPDYLTQGKASNQLNGFRFAHGLIVQAMDANMGCSRAEAFKVPFALRRFQPFWLKDRSRLAARLVGFREFIFTGLHGAVGNSHALAEWVFGTIYQRFMTGAMGMRMHYGHPRSIRHCDKIVLGRHDAFVVIGV